MVHCEGIEPPSRRPKRRILPLNYSSYGDTHWNRTSGGKRTHTGRKISLWGRTSSGERTHTCREITLWSRTSSGEVTDCIWYILSHFISTGSLNAIETTQIIDRTYTFLKYYNNNYRPIYHLESMLFYIVNKIYKLDE